MPSRLSGALAFAVAGLLVAMPTEAIAQYYGARGHGGASRGQWHGGGGYGYRSGYASGYGGWSGYSGYPAYPGYQGYGGYYPGYGGYPGYYGYNGYYGHYHHHGDDAWIAVGAGILGVMLGSVIAQGHAHSYGYPNQAPPPPPAAPAPATPAPATPRCQDGSPIPVGGFCQGPAPGPERG